MNSLLRKRNYFGIWEILIVATVTPALVYGVWTIGNLPVV